jgi:hypothetical protein
MKTTRFRALFGPAMIIGVISMAATAQTAEPTYKGDPDVYKVIFEDANFRVIEANRPLGATDKQHSHPLPSIVYNVTDCKTKLTDADGKTRETVSKADTAGAVPIIASHTAENIGTANCKQIFVEKK